MAVSSPCIGTCLIDRNQGWCVGCLRTRDEITLWSQMGEREKAGIVALCKNRQTRHGALSSLSVNGGEEE